MEVNLQQNHNSRTTCQSTQQTTQITYHETVQIDEIQQQQLAYKQEQLTHNLYNLNYHQYESQKAFVERLLKILEEKEVIELADIPLEQISQHQKEQEEIHNLKMQLQEKHQHIQRLERADNIIIQKKEAELERIQEQNLLVKQQNESFRTQYEQVYVINYKFKQRQEQDEKLIREQAEELNRLRQQNAQLQQEESQQDQQMREREAVAQNTQMRQQAQIAELQMQIKDIQRLSESKYMEQERSSAQKLSGYMGIKDRMDQLQYDYDALNEKYLQEVRQRELLEKEKELLMNDDQKLQKEIQNLKLLKEQEDAEYLRLMTDLESQIELQNKTIVQSQKETQQKQVIIEQKNKEIEELKRQQQVQQRAMISQEGQLYQESNAKLEKQKLQYETQIRLLESLNQENIRREQLKNADELKAKDDEITRLQRKIDMYQIDQSDLMRREIQNLRIELSNQRYINANLEKQLNEKQKTQVAQPKIQGNQAGVFATRTTISQQA